MLSPLNTGRRQLVICCELVPYMIVGEADERLVPLEEMQARFGDESIWVYNILRGIDHSEGTSLSLVLILSLNP
jgi:hypothetical protein